MGQVLDTQRRHLEKGFEEWTNHPNPYTHLAMLYTTVSAVLLSWFIYRKRKMIWSVRGLYEVYSLVLIFFTIFVLYLSCSWEYDCSHGGVSVSRLTNRGPVGRLWSFCMIQGAVQFVVIQTWLLSYVYKRSRFMWAVFITFPASFLVATFLAPAHVRSPIADILHTLSLMIMTVSGFGSWLWASWKAWRLPELRMFALFRVTIAAICVLMFATCLFDNWTHDAITKRWPFLFLFFEVFVIFGICSINASFYFGEMRYISLTMPSASLQLRNPRTAHMPM